MAPTKHPWDRAKQRLLHRRNYHFGQLEKLDRGVNFFVTALEALGARTRYSCEGHLKGFYVVFESSTKLARAIAQTGFFNVEVECEINTWTIRLTGNEHTSAVWNERTKRRCLRRAADAWLRKLPLPETFKSKYPIRPKP